MSNSADRRSNRTARKIAESITLPSGACVAFGPTEARAFALSMKVDVPAETNLNLLAELLNRRMPKRYPGKARSFDPYADTFRMEYREPNHDPVRTRREMPEERRTRESFERFPPYDAEQW